MLLPKRARHTCRKGLHRVARRGHGVKRGSQGQRRALGRKRVTEQAGHRSRDPSDIQWGKHDSRVNQCPVYEAEQLQAV